MDRQFKAVPWFDEFASNEKLDLKAIYRRPRRDEFYHVVKGPDGRVQWDLTGPLPLRRHLAWEAKGYKYVTLADGNSLNDAAQTLKANGHNPADYVMDTRLHPPSPWNYDLYAQSELHTCTKDLDELRQMIARFGQEAVIALRRMSDPTFELPLELREDVPAAVVEVGHEQMKRASGYDPGDLVPELKDPPKKKRGRPRKPPQPEPAEARA